MRVTVMRNAAFSASLSGQGLDASSLWMRRASGVVATRSVAAAALAGVVACVTGLVWWQDRMGGLDLLDRRCWYTPGATAALFDDLERLDAKARFVYSPTGLIIDMAFPVAYGLLLASLLFRLWPGGVPLYSAAVRHGGGRCARERDRRDAGAGACRRTFAVGIAGRGLHTGQDNSDRCHGDGNGHRHDSLAVGPRPAGKRGFERGNSDLGRCHH